MKLARILLSVACIVIVGTGIAARVETGASSPLAVPPSPDKLGPALAAPRLTAAEAIHAVKAQSNGMLFQYHPRIETHFGSYNLGIYRKRSDGAGRPLPPTQLLSPTKDYWTVTLTGLYKDSAGNDLIPSLHGQRYGPRPESHHNVTYLVDDSTDQVVSFTIF